MKTSNRFHLKAATIIESIVAMVIVMACATAGFTILAKQNKGLSNTLRVEAEMHITYVITDLKRKNVFEQNTFSFENMNLELKTIPYKNYKNIYQLVCEAYTLNHTLICSQTELIHLKRTPADNKTEK